jgi:hypothetical protein
VNRRTATPAILIAAAIAAGTWWVTSRDDARVEACREAGIESMTRLERCRESSSAMQEEIEAQREERRRAERQQVLERFAVARQKLNHTTSYAEEARQADGQLPDLMRATGLDDLNMPVDTDKRDPDRIERAATVRARLEVIGRAEGDTSYNLVWEEGADWGEGPDSETSSQNDGVGLVMLEADVSDLTDAERQLIKDACNFEYDYLIYGTMGCPVVVHGELRLVNELGPENQLAPEEDKLDWPYKTPVMKVQRIRFQEPPERIDTPSE